MAIQTQPTKESVTKFIESVEHSIRREDAKVLLKLFKEATGLQPVLWSNNVIGFGEYHYKHKSGQEGDWFLVGFSPRKTNLSLNLNMIDKDDEKLEQLGKHKASVGCMYINKLSDVDLSVLKAIVKETFTKMKNA